MKVRLPAVPAQCRAQAEEPVLSSRAWVQPLVVQEGVGVRLQGVMLVVVPSGLPQCRRDRHRVGEEAHRLNAPHAAGRARS